MGGGRKMAKRRKAVMLKVSCSACGWKGRRSSKSKIAKVRAKGVLLAQACPKCKAVGVYASTEDLGELLQKG